ncbi:endolytic transglycosylase MltG [Tepidiforma sp.]|uniref:endolytic transglycosylase MltG n=1 Tax=Tepidiforma sp. TaxID=2682230 RepID=UPI002ADE04DB|nr:endolytic transglycosylase MltG [Tepidiforma sp.]
MKVALSPFHAAGVGLVVLVVLLASYCISGTPDAVRGDLPGPRAVTAATPTTVAYTLPRGASAGEVGRALQELGVIHSARQFEVLARLLGVQGQLSAGDYLLPAPSSALATLNRLLVQDAVPVRKVTFPEGLRIEEMAVLAEQAGFGPREEFLAAVARATLPPGLAEYLPPGASLQGYLFPDTYILPVDATMDDLVAYMIETLDRRFTPELRQAALANGLNPHEALTLASIVEREAVIPAERPLIAGVFYNRLAAGDRLGADPTVQFAVAQDPASVREFGWWKKELTIVDLENPSPYNTRLFPGLPPGPICNPGLASIEAVARPEKTDYYYFVADAKAGDGSHRFAVTFAEHERNIALYGAP